MERAERATSVRRLGSRTGRGVSGAALGAWPLPEGGASVQAPAESIAPPLHRTLDGGGGGCGYGESMGLARVVVPLVAAAGFLVLLQCSSSTSAPATCSGTAPMCPVDYCATPVVMEPTACVQGEWAECAVPPPCAPLPNDDAGDGFIHCAAPLSSVCDMDASFGFGGCPPASPSSLPGPWCAANPRVGAILGSCGGYTLLAEGTGTDGVLMFMYPADAGALGAVLAAGDLMNPLCVGGAPDFAIPTSCFGTQGADLLTDFTGPGALPGCSTYDAGLDAADAAFDAADGD